MSRSLRFSVNLGAHLGSTGVELISYCFSLAPLNFVESQKLPIIYAEYNDCDSYFRRSVSNTITKNLVLC